MTPPYVRQGDGAVELVLVDDEGVSTVRRMNSDAAIRLANRLLTEALLLKHMGEWKK